MPKLTIHCPNCQKPIVSHVALGEGSSFIVKCATPTCARFVKIIAGFKHIEKRLLSNVNDSNIIQEEVTP